MQDEKNIRYSLLACLLFSFWTQAVSQSEGLVAYWSFNDSTGGDNSGNQQHGIIYGDPQPVQGVLGNAYKFYGNQYIRVPDSDILDTDSTMTISLWVKPDSFASEGSKFIGKWYASPTNGDWLFSLSGKDSCGKYIAWSAYFANYPVYGATNGFKTIGSKDTSNYLKFYQWNHIAVTFDTGYVKSYYNGALIKQDTCILKYTSLSEYGTDDIYIGRYRFDYPNYYFFGSLDEVRIYNRALTDIEIQELYQQVTNIEETEQSFEACDAFTLNQNYPNPFNPSTTISYTVRANGHSPLQQVELSIYNTLGQKVATLVNKMQPVGKYQVKWNASGLSNGVYLYRLQAGNHIQTKKMIFMK